MPRSLAVLRRSLAVLALLGTLSAVATPMCAAMTAAGPTSDHCAPGPHDRAPHHTTPLCLAGACVPLPATLFPAEGTVAPAGTTPRTVDRILTSAAPQHTSPPPRR